MKNLPRFQKLKGEVLLGIDYGKKKVGTALFGVGRDPYPMPHLRLIADDSLFSQLKDICLNEGVTLLIVGRPLLLDGKESTMTLDSDKFCQKLQHKLNLPLARQDETLSTEDAKNRMKNSPKYNFQIDDNHIDTLSAAIIVEDFIEDTRDLDVFTFPPYAKKNE